MRITFLLPNKGVGGGVRAIMRFGNELLARGHVVRIFYREDQHGLTGAVRRMYLRLIGLDQDWLDSFHGESFPYRRLDGGQFQLDELIVSMCSRTALDSFNLPGDIGIKVLHSHGAEPENRDRMLESWRLPIPKIAVSSSLAEQIKQEVGQDVLGVHLA